MSIIVEDGSVVANAVSYVTVADADAYLLARGDEVWAALTITEKEEALRKATDYMESRYGPKWLGYRVGSTQVLSWPRKWVQIPGLSNVEYYLDSEVPTVIKNVCAELAVRSTVEDLEPDQERGAIVREKVDVLDTTYAAYSPTSNRYKKVDQMIAQLTTGMGGALQVVRV